MPRQPYLSLHPKPAKIDVGTQAIRQRPELEAIIGNCLMAWAHIEAEMTVLLAQLLGAENAAALAVFQALRRSSAQRDAISEAGKASLNSADQKLLTALLNVHKGSEAERNALAHGHFGISTALPDALVWMSTYDYITIRVGQTIAAAPTWSEVKQRRLHEALYVYRMDDLRSIYEDITELGPMWFEFVHYLRTAQTHRTRADRYGQLCDRPRIALEVVKLRPRP